MNPYNGIRLSVDRTESNIVICFDDLGNKYELPTEIVGTIDDGDIIYVVFSDDEIISVSHAKEDTTSAKTSLQNRLSRMFGKNID